MNSSNNSQTDSSSLHSTRESTQKVEISNPDTSTLTSYWVESFLDKIGNTALNLKRRYTLRNKNLNNDKQ